MPGHQEVSIYTTLVLLQHMRSSLGLEAMSEFIDSYTAAVDRIHPQLKNEVNSALQERALSNLYENVRSYESI